MIFTIFFLFWALLLKERFGYSPLDIGLTGTKIGVAELVGLLIAGLVVDRIGKRKGTLIGFGASAVIFPFFLLVQNSIVLIHALLVFFMFAFEFGITATIPLIAEQTDSNRATLFCMVSLGNTIGAGLGPPLVAYLWALGGSLAVGITTSILLVVMVLLVFYYLFDKETPEGEEMVSIA